MHTHTHQGVVTTIDYAVPPATTVKNFDRPKLALTAWPHPNWGLDPLPFLGVSVTLLITLLRSLSWPKIEHYEGCLDPLTRLEKLPWLLDHTDRSRKWNCIVHKRNHPLHAHTHTHAHSHNRTYTHLHAHTHIQGRSARGPGSGRSVPTSE